MKIVLINPNIVTQIIDVSGTGIPYLPIALSYLAAYLRNSGYDITVIDGFGQAPSRIKRQGDKFYQGLDKQEIIESIPEDVEIIGIYAHLTVTFEAQRQLIKAVRAKFPSVPIMVLENINKVNAYVVSAVAQQYFGIGVDYLVPGYLEQRTVKLLELIRQGEINIDNLRQIPGLIFKHEAGYECNPGLEQDWDITLDKIPFPAWDLFPLEKYWKLKYAHAPFSSAKYLTLLSSRGCPFDCRFCVSNSMVSNRKWNPRTVQNIVDEICFFKEKFGVEEFHFEDLNPGLDKDRISEFCDALIERNVKIKWKFAQGTRLESLDKDVIAKMAKAGCNYVSISPENGSVDLLKSINKPVDLEKSIQVVKCLKEYKVVSQACFVIGLPGETDADLKLTRKLLLRLAKAGLDEPAIFIITVMPGSQLWSEYKEYNVVPDQCTFTPVWRKDYKRLARFRKVCYLQYLGIKILYYPLAFTGYIINFFSRNFKTKVEMTIYRKLYTIFFYIKGGSSRE